MSPEKKKTGGEKVDITPAERLNFAANLKAARKAAGITQTELSKMTGHQQYYLSLVERGIKTTTIDIAAELAIAVGVPLHELLQPSALPKT